MLTNKMEVTDKNFDDEVLNSELPVLVDFWASWCPPCKMMEPLIEKIEHEFKGKVKICKLNVDRNPKTADKYMIKGVPTFILFNKGDILKREVAALSESKLKSMIGSFS
jgi:thioredoxin 1